MSKPILHEYQQHDMFTKTCLLNSFQQYNEKQVFTVLLKNLAELTILFGQSNYLEYQLCD